MIWVERLSTVNRNLPTPISTMMYLGVHPMKKNLSVHLNKMTHSSIKLLGF